MITAQFLFRVWFGRVAIFAATMATYVAAAEVCERLLTSAFDGWPSGMTIVLAPILLVVTWQMFDAAYFDRFHADKKRARRLISRLEKRRESYLALHDRLFDPASPTGIRSSHWLNWQLEQIETIERDDDLTHYLRLRRRALLFPAVIVFPILTLQWLH